MTDEEINKRVAEIEGWVFVPWDTAKTQRGMHTAYWQRSEGERWFHHYPPPYATDWQWAGPLVDSYIVNISGTPGAWQACCLNEINDQWAPYSVKMADTPQRAICLAVIAAHEGKG